MTTPQTIADELAEKLMIKLDKIAYPSNTYWCNEVKRLILTELNLTSLLADKEMLDWLEKNQVSMLPPWGLKDDWTFEIYDGEDDFGKSLRLAITTVMKERK